MATATELQYMSLYIDLMHGTLQSTLAVPQGLGNSEMALT